MKKFFIGISALIIALSVNIFTVWAQVPTFIIYEGRLLDKFDQPVTTAYMFRFSLWSSDDFNSATDLLADGTINTTSAGYGQWQEEQIVTPNDKGIFSVQLGKVMPFTGINFALHKHLQVEIKAVGDPVTSYQLMDPTGDAGADTDDRKDIGSMPYALNAENAYQSEAETFILDADNTKEGTGAGAIQLQFGSTLGKVLEYDLTNSYFNFNDSVNIQGDLTLTGLINGVDVVTLTHPQNTDLGTSSATFVINNGGNRLVLDSSSLTANRTLTFPDGDTELVGTDTVQTLTNKTIDGDLNTIINIDRSSLKNQNNTILLSPDYQNISIYQDGSNNKASIYAGNDGDEKYYVLTSDQSTMQDLDLQITVGMPTDFVGWQTSANVGEKAPLQIYVRSTTANPADAHLEATLLDSTNASVALNNGDDLTSTVVDTWIVKDIEIINPSAFTFNPGESVLLNLKLQANSGNRLYVGKITLNYIGK